MGKAKQDLHKISAMAPPSATIAHSFVLSPSASSGQVCPSMGGIAPFDSAQDRLRQTHGERSVWIRRTAVLTWLQPIRGIRNFDWYPDSKSAEVSRLSQAARGLGKCSVKQNQDAPNAHRSRLPESGPAPQT